MVIALVSTALFLLWGGLSDPILYRLALLIPEISSQLCIGNMLLALWVAVVSVIAAPFARSKRQKTHLFDVMYQFVALAFIASVIPIFGVFRGIQGEFSRPLSTIYTGQHVYYLVQFADSEAYPEEQLLYVALRCGRFGFICKNIYQGYRWAYGDRPEITSINLLHDPQTNTVSLEVNGEIVLSE